MKEQIDAVLEHRSEVLRLRVGRVRMEAGHGQAVLDLQILLVLAGRLCGAFPVGPDRRIELNHTDAERPG